MYDITINMSQAYKTIKEYQSVSVSSTLVQVNLAGSSVNLGNNQSGEVVTLNSTGGSVVTLPFPMKGLQYKFIVSATGGHTITAPSACIYGAVCNAVSNTGASILSTGSAKTIIATTTGSAVGDSFSLVCDGSKYFVSGSVSQFNALKFI